MEPPKQGGRAIKKRVLKALKSQDCDMALKDLCRFPARRVISPLFSSLYNTDEAVKWAAVAAMGVIVGKLADDNMEEARVIMRRLMWNLNDESGGIGWGSPEAMGEIMAVHEGLAKEYVHILLSYTRKDGNYLETEGLQRGLLWGIGRLAQARPELVKEGVTRLMPYLSSPDAGVRGLAAWIMGLLEVEEAQSELESLTKDEAELQMVFNRKVNIVRVKDLAKKALGQFTK
jgi:hypothetical protein